MICSFLGIIEAHLGIILTISGFLFALYTYKKDVKAKIIRKLAREVVAFYCIEQAAIKMLKKQMPDVPEQTIQRRLRDEAVKNENNIEGLRATMSANGARKFL